MHAGGLGADHGEAKNPFQTCVERRPLLRGPIHCSEGAKSLRQEASESWKPEASRLARLYLSRFFPDLMS